MKKLLFSILATSVLFAGCAKENVENTSTASRVGDESTKVIEFSTQTLKFANMEEMLNTIIDISAMNAEQRQQWDAKNVGFTSMQAAGYMIVEQMKAIGNKEGILAMRPAYSDLFIFDPNTEEVRVAPQFKASKPGYQWICNAYGDVEIGNKIVNLNDITTFEETWIGKGSKTRDVGHLELVGNRHRLIVASSCNLWQGRAQVFIRYSSEINISSTWYPDGDTYTVRFLAGTTNNEYILEPDTRFNYYLLKNAGNSFSSMTMSPYYLHDDFIGWLTQSYETGYEIYSAQTGKTGPIPVYNY